MSKTVLIVEDNELNMKLFCDLLSAHGYDTLQADDGVVALQLAREHRPDLIVMDILLPELSGLEVTKWIKQDDDLKSIPVVAVTAFSSADEQRRFQDGGCDAFIPKPISVGSFVSTLEQLMN
ncbi:MAG: response regulator [Minwuiales bacterium]|nr:response regulator [Minwuiales bacterium]